MTDRLLGRWRLIRTEAAEGMESVAIEFDSSGNLTYSVDLGDRLQIFNLTYQVQGDTIVTDQPSERRIEVTRFSIGLDDVLELEKDGDRSWYERVA